MYMYFPYYSSKITVHATLLHDYMCFGLVLYVLLSGVCYCCSLYNVIFDAQGEAEETKTKEMGSSL